MDLNGRSLLKETDLSAEEFLFLIEQARQLRADKRRGVTGRRLAGRNIAEGAAGSPLVCLIDDAQWLDRETQHALAFAARRLTAGPGLMVFATREPLADLSGLPELEVTGLRAADAGTLLASVVRWPLDDRVRDRIVAETRGNPLELLTVRQAQPTAGLGLLDAQPLPGQIEPGLARELDALPALSRRLLVIAAAEPAGDPALVWRAATRLGVPATAARPAVQAGLVAFGARVTFRHPLVRSAAYRSVSLRDRQHVHRVLAEATDPRADPDHRAWHLAQAASVLRRALSAITRTVQAPADQELRWLRLAGPVARHVWDDQAWDALSGRYLRLVRDAGALSELPAALSRRAYLQLCFGELATAAALADALAAAG